MFFGYNCRYKRRKETKNILEYIHRGSNAAAYGAWDFLTSILQYKQLEDLLLKFKKGKLYRKIARKIYQGPREK